MITLLFSTIVSALLNQPFGLFSGEIEPEIGYLDPTDAAKHVLLEVAVLCPQDVECGGVIYLGVDGRFYPTIPETSYQPFEVEMPQYYHPLPPKMLRIAADYHNHICSPHNKIFANYFSPADAIANEGFHTTGYMLSFCDGNIRRYDPVTDAKDDEWVVHFESGREIVFKIGHVVGWIPIKPTHAKRHPSH